MPEISPHQSAVFTDSQVIDHIPVVVSHLKRRFAKLEHDDRLHCAHVGAVTALSTRTTAHSWYAVMLRASYDEAFEIVRLSRCAKRTPPGLGVCEVRDDTAVEGREIDPAEAASERERKRLVLQAVAGLRENLKEVTRGFMDGKSLREMAEEAGVTPTHVHRRLKLAFEFLAKSLDEKGCGPTR